MASKQPRSDKIPKFTLKTRPEGEHKRVMIDYRDSIYTISKKAGGHFISTNNIEDLVPFVYEGSALVAINFQVRQFYKEFHYLPLMEIEQWKKKN